MLLPFDLKRLSTLQMLILSKNVPPFVKTEVLLSCSQDPDDEPYPAEDQSSPRTQSLFICYPF